MLDSDGVTQMDKRAQGSLLSAEDQVELVDVVQAGGQAARRAQDVLVLRNMGLVHSVLMTMVKPHEPRYQDFVGEGVIALITAIHLYDKGVGIAFASYAHEGIRRSILSKVRADRTITLSQRDQRLAWRMKGAFAKLTMQLGREPTVGELAQDLEADPNLVESIMMAIAGRVSLDAPAGVDDDSRTSLIDTLSDDAEHVGHEYEDAEVRTILRKALNSLCERDRAIIMDCFGLSVTDGKDQPVISMADIARRISEADGGKSISSERVRQLRNAALKKLQEALLSHGVDSSYA